MVLLTLIRTEIERFQNRHFLEAAMAVCALTGAADGGVSFAERYQVDTILATLDQLKVYEPHQAVDILNDYIDRLSADRETAIGTLHVKIGRFAGYEEAALVLLHIAYLVMTADGRIEPGEQAMFDEICSVLAMTPSDVLAGFTGRSA